MPARRDLGAVGGCVDGFRLSGVAVAPAPRTAVRDGACRARPPWLRISGPAVDGPALSAPLPPLTPQYPFLTRPPRRRPS